MKFHYYSETDSLYIELTERDSVESKEASPGVVLDYDSDGVLVGIDIDHASSITDVTGLENVKPGKVLAPSASGKIPTAAVVGVLPLMVRLIRSFFGRPPAR